MNKKKTTTHEPGALLCRNTKARFGGGADNEVVLLVAVWNTFRPSTWYSDGGVEVHGFVIGAGAPALKGAHDIDPSVANTHWTVP